MRTAIKTLAAVVVLAVAASSAVAEDWFLTIGGGYYPEGNQASLEKNVLLFRRLLDEFYPDGVPQYVYFADGDNPNRDLQFVDPGFEVPRAHRLLAMLFGRTADIAQQYRDHQIDHLDGPASRRALEEWFEDVGSTLGPEDRLFIYSTAHGGRASDKERPFDTTLYLWNRQRLDMHEFVELLDEVPSEVPVVMVMVQCYSGGFAHSIFNAGNAADGLSAANRCGFFATVENRVAAGCTPDIDEANYREYSTYFFAALRGKTRYDEPLEKPDYDGDGRISFAEAHAYTVLTSTTIDIPVRTSDAFLRQYSRIETEDESDSGNAPAGADCEPDDSLPDEEAADGPMWLTAETDYDVLITYADVIDRTIIDGLSEQLELSGANRVRAARRHARDIQNERSQLDRKRRNFNREYNGIRDRIKRSVLDVWPEMNNPWHPVTTRVLTGNAAQIVDLVESHPRFQQMQELAAKIEEIDEQNRDHDREWVKCQRLIRTLESVALAANLPQVAAPDVVERYLQLRRAESASFGSAQP